MENEKLVFEYEPNYNSNFISSSVTEIKNGGVCYVYSQNVLSQLQQKLDSLGIIYTIKKVEDYWSINSIGKEKKHGKK